MKTKFFLFFISFFLISSLANAQVNDLLNAAKKKAGKTVEKRVEKETEKAVNKVIDKTVEKASEKLKKNEEENGENAPTEENGTTTEPKKQSKNQSSGGGVLDLVNKYTGGENLVYENEYDFSAEVKYKITSVDENGEEGEAIYRTLFAEGSNNTAMIMESAENKGGNESSTIIFDQKNMVTIMLNDAEKTGMVMGLSGYQQHENTEEPEVTEEIEEEEINLNFKKTGNSKKILGYTCYEYVSANEELETIVWTTTELKFSGNTALSQMNKMNNFYTAGVYPSGFVMEMISQNLQNNSKMTTTVLEFDESKSNSFSLSKYQLVKMGTNYNNQ